MTRQIATRVELLRHVPYFTGVPVERMREVAKRMQERRYKAGAVIFLRGERCDGLYLVISGRVATVKVSPEGREQVLHVFGPGKTFGDIGVFDGGPHAANAQAVRASVVALIAVDDLHRVVAEYPAASTAALRYLAGRLRAFTQIVEDISLRPVVARTARVLLDLARGEQNLVEDAATLAPQLTQREIATMVGSVRVVVQRSLTSLQDAGAIRLTRGKIRILDLQKLEHWSNQTLEGLRNAPARSASRRV
jgi:CRP-like cAMP-binding protein